MSEDEIIRVVLAIGIGVLVFTVFRRGDTTSIGKTAEKGRRNARMAMILFISGSVMAMLYMAVNADI